MVLWWSPRCDSGFPVYFLWIGLCGFAVAFTSGRLVIVWGKTWDLPIERFESVTDDADKVGKGMVSWRAVDTGWDLAGGCTIISWSFLLFGEFCDFTSSISSKTLSLACALAISVSRTRHSRLLKASN